MYNITEKETQPNTYSHINGSIEEILDRYCVSELCKGWPVYRDASEWNNYRSLFAEKGAFVFTTWSGGLSIEDFIEVSKRGRAKGDFIMHRENGTLVDLNPSTLRAVGKMKATITQRFTFDNITFDIECDCRFIFFCHKSPTSTSGGKLEWKMQYSKLFYEKDKVVPVDGKTVPTFTEEELSKYPVGYQLLGAAQAKLGHEILGGLPTLNNQAFFTLYQAIDEWLQGKNVENLLGVPQDYKPKF